MEIGQSWRESFLEKLQGAFGGNLLFAGLQGSRARGEAGPRSDIDLVVVLEQVEEREISAYRELLASMEGGGLACGFLCGRRELAAWPRYDSLTLLLDTVPWYGSLQPLLPPFSPQDAEEAVRIAAAGLYHAACHSLLFPRTRPRRRKSCGSRCFSFCGPGCTGTAAGFSKAAGPCFRKRRRRNGPFSPAAFPGRLTCRRFCGTAAACCAARRANVSPEVCLW